jgi:16S rRNA (cytosine1402-N4)-methyltransferase
MGNHISVLLPETLQLLDVRDGGVYVDLTLGRAGTSSEILKRIPHGRLIAFDLDQEAISESQEKLARIGSNFTIIHSNFAALETELNRLGIGAIDGLTADLGVSSPQFDEAERGFSYKEDARLDMRMNLDQALTAEIVVNTYPEHELIRIFRSYGEDPDSVLVAKAIVKARVSAPIETTTQLVDTIKKSKPMRSLLKKGHPAKQIFQALRIEVNGELANLTEALDSVERVMAPLGRAVFISFHSLEDRIIKDKFRDLCVVEGDRHGIELLPSEITEAPFLSLTRKPIEASEEEKKNNHRATSAKLRAIQRKGEPL